MNRSLQIANFFGVLALAALCIVQWRVNRQVNLEVNRLHKTRLDCSLRLEEQQNALKGCNADLESFREQLHRAGLSSKEAQSKLTLAEREIVQLTNERDQLKESVAAWAKAVADRDEQLKRSARHLENLAADRNETVIKFNELAAKHNSGVKYLNERTQQLNELVEQYKKLTKQ